MERNFLQDNWHDLRSQLGEWWDELTDEDLDLINGNQEELINVLRQRYGYTEALARAEVEKRILEDYDPESTGL